MGVQPIDLQTMYSQLSNVAKQAAHLEQGVQLAKSMQQNDVVKINAEQAQKVQQTGEDSKASTVNQNGKNSSGFQKKKNNQHTEEQAEEKDESDKYRLKEDFLGQHIDITR